MTIRTRFAPSPTGYLHIGGARTALYAWLYAKHFEGQFILRIEDTDRERSTEEAVQAILDGMSWLGLTADEGPFYQTKRMDRYQEVVQKLLNSGHAYRCYCSKERLSELREKQMQAKEKPRYDGCCRGLGKEKDEPYVIRFKNPEKGGVTFDDLVHGKITVKNKELDDLIIARTDGTPTYNLTVVVDDLDMEISHVIRGDDHINNTPRQINIFNALGATPPVYAHLPMIHGPDGKKLSKRHGAASVMEFRDSGYLPEALLNYLLRLGWSHGDQELFDIPEMIALFDGNHLNNSAAAINPEKLLWLNQHYIKNSNRHDVAKELAWHFEQIGVDVANGPELIEIVAAQAERSKTLREMAETSRYFYEDVKSYDEKAARKNFKPETAHVLNALVEGFGALADWKKEPLHEVIKQTSEALELGMGKVAQPIRVAITGNTVSPSIDTTLQLLGRDKTLVRLKKAETLCSNL